MINMAISIAWLLIGVVCLLAAVYLALYIIKLFVSLPDPVEKAVWAIVVLLIFFGILTVLAGGGGIHSPFRLSGIAGPSFAAGSYAAAFHLPGMLG